MSQTDLRAVEHRAKLEQAIDNMEKTSVCLDIFDRAMADAERVGMERAAKMMCSYCNDPQWPRSAIVQGNAVHIGPITGSLFPCNAMQIHSALRAQAQADKEEK